jgi:hypothetical protein
LSQLRQREHELTALGVRVAVITFEAGPLVEAYARDTGLEWPILLDTSLELYRAYGMGRGRIWHVWGPPAWWIYARLLVRGRRLRRPTGDVNQLGGDVLIGPDGMVRLHVVGRGPADRPSVDWILDLAGRRRGRGVTAGPTGTR